MKVRELMRKRPKTAYLTTSLESVWKLVAYEQTHMVPVLDNDDHLRGIITAEDLIIGLIPDYSEFFSNFYPDAPKFKDIQAKLAQQASRQIH